jgi:hypothetical protein
MPPNLTPIDPLKNTPDQRAQNKPAQVPVTNQQVAANQTFTPTQGINNVITSFPPPRQQGGGTTPSASNAAANGTMLNQSNLGAAQPTQPTQPTQPQQTAQMDASGNLGASGTPAQVRPTNFQGQQQDFTREIQQRTLGALDNQGTNFAPQVDPAIRNILQNPDVVSQEFLRNQQQQLRRQQNLEFERLRRNTADIGNTGAQGLALQNLGLQQAQQRADLAFDQQAEANRVNREALLQAISAAGQREQLGADIQSQSLNDLIASGQLGQQGAALDVQQRIAQMDNDLQLRIQNNELTFEEAQMESDNRQRQLDRELQREIEAGRLSIADRELLQQARQFDSRLEFDQWATQAGLDDAQASRVWESTERLKDRTFQSTENALDRANQLDIQKMSIESQTALAELQAKLATDQLLLAQDFESVQAQLNRDLDVAMQNGDFQHAMRILETQNDFAAAQAQADREFARSERVATQTWQSGEAISDRDFQKGMATLEHKYNLAVQNRDFANQRMLQQSMMEFEMAKQYNTFSQEERMAQLNNDLAEAQANNDVMRQQAIMGYGHSLEMNRIASEQGFEAAMRQHEMLHQAALQNADHVQAEVLQRKEFEFRAEQAIEDRLLQQASLSLQARGLSMREFETKLAAAQSSGDPQAVESLYEEMGIDFDPARVAQSIRENIAEEFDLQRLAFAQTAPDDMVTISPDGTRELNIAGLEAFNEHVNGTIYQTEEGMSHLIEKVQAGEKPAGDFEVDEIQSLMNNTSIIEFTGASKRSGKGSSATEIYSELHSLTNGGMFKVQPESSVDLEPGVYKMLSKTNKDKFGRDETHYTVVNVQTGEQTTLKAKK